MQLEHSFSVPVPVEVAWQALLDPEGVAPCFPGATLTGVDGPEFTGTVKVRMGPIALLYKGTGKFTESDETTRTVVLEATGKDSRGNGTASATVTAKLAPAVSGEGTDVAVVTDLTITGKPAQMGRGLIGEVGGKIIDRFAECLAQRLTEGTAVEDAPGSADSVVPAVPAVTTPPPPSSAAATAERRWQPPATSEVVVRPAVKSSGADEIDLLEFAGQPLLKRLAPVAVAGLVLVLVLRWVRGRRR